MNCVAEVASLLPPRVLVVPFGEIPGWARTASAQLVCQEGETTRELLDNLTRDLHQHQALSVDDRILVSHGFRPITKPVSLKGCFVALSRAIDARLDELLREVSVFRDRLQASGCRAQGSETDFRVQGPGFRSVGQTGRYPNVGPGPGLNKLREPRGCRIVDASILHPTSNQGSVGALRYATAISSLPAVIGGAHPRPASATIGTFHASARLLGAVAKTMCS